MAHSVTISNQIPSFEETAEFYGLSKADRKFVSSLFAPFEGRSSDDSRTSVSIDRSSVTGRFVCNSPKRKAGKTNSRARKAA
jgi:hypothetical protein